MALLDSEDILTFTELNKKIVDPLHIRTLNNTTYTDVYNFYYRPLETDDTNSMFVVNEDNRFRLPKTLNNNSLLDDLSQNLKTYINQKNSISNDMGHIFIDYINSHLVINTNNTYSESINIENNYNAIITNLNNDSIDIINYDDEIIKKSVIFLYKIRSKYENDSSTYDDNNKKAMSYKNPQHLMIEYYEFGNVVGLHIHKFIVYNNELIRLHNESANKNDSVLYIDNTNEQLNTNIDSIFKIISNAVSTEIENDILIKTSDILDDDLISKFSYIIGYYSYYYSSYNEDPTDLRNFALLKDINTQKYFWFTSLNEYNNNNINTPNFNIYENGIIDDFGMLKFYFKVLDVIFSSTETNPAVYSDIDSNNYINIKSMSADDYNRYTNTINNENTNKEVYNNNNNLIIKTWYDFLISQNNNFENNPFNNTSYIPMNNKWNVLDTKIYNCFTDSNKRIQLFNDVTNYTMEGDVIKTNKLFTDCDTTLENSSKTTESFQGAETTKLNLSQKLRNAARINHNIGVQVTRLNNTSNPNRKSNIGIIVGSVTGGVVLIGLILFLVLKKQRKFKKKSQLKPKSQLNKKGKKGKK